MRKIIVGTFISLDGVMQAPGGPDEDTQSGFKYGGWVFPYFDQGVDAAMSESMSEPFDLLLGRKTYDIFAAHWPRVAADPAAAGVGESEAELARTFNKITKYVATHRPESLKWQNSESLGSDVVASLKKIKSGSGPALLVQGSSELIHLLLAHDLVDQLNLLTFPVVLGKGKRLFAENAHPSAFKLKKSVTSPSGVVIASYERAGEITAGSFQLPPE